MDFVGGPVRSIRKADVDVLLAELRLVNASSAKSLESQVADNASSRTTEIASAAQATDALLRSKVLAELAAGRIRNYAARVGMPSDWLTIGSRGFVMSSVLALAQPSAGPNWGSFIAIGAVAISYIGLAACAVAAPCGVGGTVIAAGSVLFSQLGVLNEVNKKDDGTCTTSASPYPVPGANDPAYQNWNVNASAGCSGTMSYIGMAADVIYDGKTAINLGDYSCTNASTCSGTWGPHGIKKGTCMVFIPKVYWTKGGGTSQERYATGKKYCY